VTAPKRARREASGANHTDDVHAWAEDQVRFLRTGAWSRLDIAHLADEIADVGRSERHAPTSALGVILLRWDHQPTRRSRSWVTSIRIRRSMVAERLNDNPSPRAQMDGPIAPAYRRARIAAADETGLDEDTFRRPAPMAGMAA
jgi:hypothetical protein